MIDWSLPPDLQAYYDRVTADIRRLQAELGIEPMTLEERHQAYIKRKEQEARLEQLKQAALKRRPLPKWKV